MSNIIFHLSFKDLPGTDFGVEIKTNPGKGQRTEFQDLYGDNKTLHQICFCLVESMIQLCPVNGCSIMKLDMQRQPLNEEEKTAPNELISECSDLYKKRMS